MIRLDVLFKWTLVAMATFAISCGQDLNDDVNDLKDRVTSLENSVDELQKAIESGKLITAVEPVEGTSTTPGGWKITFSDNNTLVVNHGKTGTPGVDGKTPYVWINSAGNWATAFGAKPADSNDAKYEIKVDGASVKAQGPQGISVRVVDQGGYVAFQTYNSVTGDVIATTATNFPFDGGMIITSITETDESVIFTIDKKEYTLAKAVVYPASITIIRDREYVKKGGSVSFNIAVNPATSKVYAKEAFELDYEKSYHTRAYGVEPGFIAIESIEPDAAIVGQYKVTLKWDAADEAFAKNAAIFVVLNYTDNKGALSQVISATPVIMNEEYVSIASKNVVQPADIELFTDETYSDVILLDDYHPGYVGLIDYSYTANPVTDPVAINPMGRDLADKYKFTVLPLPGTNPIVWPDGFYKRVVDVKVSVSDTGLSKVPEIPAKPELGQPAVPEIPALPIKTADKNFRVTVYKVPANNVIYTYDFGDRWLPNTTVNSQVSQTLAAEFTKNGYNVGKWDFAIASQTLTINNGANTMDLNLTPDEREFASVDGYKVSYKLLPTMKIGSYVVTLNITATTKTPRPAGLSSTRDFKVKLLFNVVAPKFKIYTEGKHTLIDLNSDTYHTYDLSDVKIETLIDVESTVNISKSTDVNPTADPLSYEFDKTDPRHGAQGVRFNPFPVVTAPSIGDWGFSSYIKKPIVVNVKLLTGQEIPVSILCTVNDSQHSFGRIYVQYNRLNLVLVSSKVASFAGNYNSMISTGKNIAENANFTPLDRSNISLHKTMIQSIVYSAQGNVSCSNGPIPNGLLGKQILKIDAATGVVSSIDGMTWENPDAVLFQTFRVTYTDIWGNSAYTEVKVSVKSNGIPTLP